MFFPRSTTSRIGLFITSLSIAVPLPASALSLFDAAVLRVSNDPTTFISLNEYGSFIQAVSGPFSLPGISSATFQADRGSQLGDGEFSRFVIPLSRSFENLAVGGITPYAEVTLSDTEQKQNTFWMESTPMQMMVRHDVKTTSIMGGVGADFEPVNGLVIRPMVLLGWSRIKDDSKPTTAMGRRFQAAVEKNLFAWQVDQRQYGPALEVEYKTVVGNDIRVFPSARVTQLNIKTNSTSTSGLEESNEFYSISGNVELDGPTSLSIYEWDVRWQGFSGVSKFDDKTSDALNFSWLGEIGVGLLIVDSKQNTPLVESLSLRGSMIFGDSSINGWTIGITATF